MQTVKMLMVSCLTVGGALVVGATGCLRSTSFECTMDSQCGPGGSCEAVGYCSVADVGCPSGQRFGSSAGSYADQCVEGGAPVDGSVADAPAIDAAMPDAPMPGACPASFDMIMGGEGTHVYRVLTMSASWAQQRDACVGLSSRAYLAIPGSDTELAALIAQSSATRLWVGVTDSANEGTWLDVKGMAPMFLPWGAGQPDNAQQGEDCASADGSEFRDDRCSFQFRAVCECEP